MPDTCLMVQIFHRVGPAEAPDAPADRILLELIKPLFSWGCAEGKLRGASFLRFSSRGYHVRSRFFGVEHVLRSEVEPRLQEEFGRHVALYPGDFEGEAPLSGLSATLHRKWREGGAASSGPLPPGTYDASYPDLSPEVVNYESEAVRLAERDLQTDASLRSLDLLALRPPRPVLRAFLRMLLDDALRITGLSPRDLFLLMRCLEEQWIGFFEISAEQLSPHRQAYAEKRDRYLKFFAEKRGPEDSLPTLPTALHGPFLAWLESLRGLLPPIVARNEHGLVSELCILRLEALFHLSHNRFGISLLDEISTAHMLADHYRRQLDEDTAAGAEAEASALARRMTPG